MKFAWIENNIIRDFCVGNPTELFVAEIAAFYNTEILDSVERGATFLDGVWVNPPPLIISPPILEPIVEPVLNTSIKVSPIEFKLLFKSTERIAIKALRATDLAIDDFYDILEDPRLTLVDLGLQSTKDGVNYISSLGVYTEARAAEILAGIPQ